MTCRALTQPRSLPTMTNDAMKERAPAPLSARELRILLRVGEADGSASAFRSAPPPRKIFMTSRKNRGFSLLEMMIVIAIGMTVAGISVHGADADAARDPRGQCLRHDAVGDAQLPETWPSPPANATSSRSRLPAPSLCSVGTTCVPVSPAPVTVATYTLPPDIQFAVQPGFPAAAPDGFGTGSDRHRLRPMHGPGQPELCDVHARRLLAGHAWATTTAASCISRGPATITGRAPCTVWGTTGRIRGWRVYLQSGVNTWVQQ